MEPGSVHNIYSDDFLKHLTLGDSHLRVQLGKLEDFIKTACLTSLSFIQTSEDAKGEYSKIVSPLIQTLIWAC